MKITKIKQSLLAALLVCGTCTARAGVASGDYTNSLSADVGLWDFSGDYTDDFQGAPLTYTIEMDASGKLSGAGVGTIADDSAQAYFDLAVSLDGSARSAGGVVRVILNIKLSGTGQVAGQAATFSAILRYNLELDTSGYQLTGTGRGRVTETVAGMSKTNKTIPPFDVQLDLPDDMTGDWTLELHVSPSGIKYDGAGEIALSNGNTFPVVVTGSYNSKSDVSKLTLKGTGPDRGISLTLLGSAADGELTLQKVNGKALGQTLRVSGGQ